MYDTFPEKLGIEKVSVQHTDVASTVFAHSHIVTALEMDLYSFSAGNGVANVVLHLKAKGMFVEMRRLMDVERGQDGNGQIAFHVWI